MNALWVIDCGFNSQNNFTSGMMSSKNKHCSLQFAESHRISRTPPPRGCRTSGGATDITCVAVGSPMPFVKWRLGAIELTPEDNIPIGKNVLLLADVMESANYTCVATSDLGNIESKPPTIIVNVGHVQSLLQRCPNHPLPGSWHRR